jgi:NAD(P)-dependent dehydrogenase (short-subunit alcohol dehydrogenase family)
MAQVGGRSQLAGQHISHCSVAPACQLDQLSCPAGASCCCCHAAGWLLTDLRWLPAGADGFATPQYAAYGATKAALPQLLGSLQAELAGSAVGVHIVSPGMMLTELLLENASVANKQVGRLGVAVPAACPLALVCIAI